MGEPFAEQQNEQTQVIPFVAITYFVTISRGGFDLIRRDNFGLVRQMQGHKSLSSAASESGG
jgi:hypothetical protein